MNKFNDWPIRRKLMFAFCLSAVLTALLGGLGFSSMKQMQSETTLINQDVVPVLSRLSELRGFAGEFRVYEVGQFVNLEDPERYAYFFKRMDEIQSKYAETQKQLDAKIGPASPLKAEYAKLTDASARYFAANQQLRKLYADPDRAAAMEFSRKQSGEIRKELFASIDKLYAQQSKALNDMVAASAASFKLTSAVLLIGTLLMA
ncbi:methyl-accepting chemotaxis protein, partial [Xanthomonas vasicola]